jgi:hypothetical protein
MSSHTTVVDRRQVPFVQPCNVVSLVLAVGRRFGGETPSLPFRWPELHAYMSAADLPVKSNPAAYGNREAVV